VIQEDYAKLRWHINEVILSKEVSVNVGSIRKDGAIMVVLK
jgi:hypothetical protein